MPRRPALAPLVALLALGLAGLALAAPASGRTLVVERGGSIQAAVDRAEAGDRVIVQAGVYTPERGEAQVVRVERDDLTLIGLPGAVIDGEGRADHGVAVGPRERGGCLDAPAVEGFHLQGFTVRNASEAGVSLNRATDFALVGTRYESNGGYGAFPVCSRDGRVVQSHASGHEDAAFYVGDDDNVVLEDNIATDNTIGVQVENTTGTAVRRNVLHGNTAGILVLAAPGLPSAETRDTELTGNYVADNNRPNPHEPDPLPLGLVPRGTGVLNLGSDALTVRRNVILQNGTVGIASLGSPFAEEDSRLEPFVDGQVVRGNVILRNGARPDGERWGLAAADVVFLPDAVDPLLGEVVTSDPDPSDSCFERNLFEGDYPDGVVGDLACP